MIKRILIPLFLILAATATLHAQTRRITGVVKDSAGNPLPNASVTVKNGKGSGASTSLEGSFSLTVQNNATLLVSAIGYESQEISSSSNGLNNIRLLQSRNALDEVVVTALGVKREKRQLTYSTQEVKGDVLNSTKEPNVLNALTGRVSGVQITSSTGQPGSSARIVIRGLTSFTGNNEALIVLDGVPIDNSETGNAGSGAGVSRLSDIDPSIIESVNVLKGSAASALYGSKGARGVVLITTKNGGANRKPQITVNSQVSVETPILPQVQEKYALGDRGNYANGENQKTSTVWGPRIDTLRVNGQPVYYNNPIKQFFRKGLTYTNGLTLSGGSGKNSYLLSYTYLDQKGTVPTTGLKRHTAFAKYTSHISEKFTANFQMNYTTAVTDRINEGYDLTAPLWTVYTSPFTWNPKPAVDSLGNQRMFRASRNNPYWVLDNIHNTDRINRFIPVANITYTPLSWLTVTERVGADIYSEQTKYREAPSNTLNTVGTVIDQNRNSRLFNHDLIIDARKQFGEDWNVNVLLGNNVYSSFGQTYNITAAGLTIPNFYNVSNGSTITASESHSLYRKVGFYAQSNIEYKRMLNLSLTGRYDGTSLLAKGNNYYPYGSGSLGFIFSELLKVPAIDFGKLRVSLSEVGNEDALAPYSLNTPYVRPTNFPYDSRAGFLITSALGNSTLKNETTREFETGLEMRFLHNRIGFEASYYYRKHMDLLTSVSTSAATGFTSTVLNAGDMTNKGVEVLLNGTPIKTRNFSWDVTATFTKNNNVVNKIYGNQQSLSIGQTQLFVGLPYGNFYNVGYQRTADGQYLIDANGLPMVTTTSKIIGNIQPDWLAGITNNFRFKSLSFSFFFDMRKGGQILNSDDRYGYFYGTPKVTENRQPLVVPGISIVDNKPNTKVVQAEDYYQRLNLIYESVIQDGTYIKLRNVNLNYNMPATWFSKSVFSGISLTATGRNLWIYSPHFTGADPEVSSYGSSNGSQGVYGYTVPTSRSYNFTVTATLR